jgi:hypothetical protein
MAVCVVANGLSFFMNTKNANAKTDPTNLGRRQVLYIPAYRGLTKSLPAAILLSQLMYWHDLMKGQKFYKKDTEIMQETALTPNELRAAKVKLKHLVFIKMTVEGVPARTFYDINLAELKQAISKVEPVKSTKQDMLIPLKQFSEIHETELVNTTKQDSLNSLNKISENHETITLDYKRDYTLNENSDSEAPTKFNELSWMEVAQKMTEYVQAEGKAQWDFMCQVTNFRGDALQLFSNWAGKASPYELTRWKEMIPKLQNWMRNHKQTTTETANEFEKPKNSKVWNIM